MKDLLFMMVVLLLMPAYIIIKTFSCVFIWIIEITESIADGISYYVEDMVEFWKKFLKRGSNNE